MRFILFFSLIQGCTFHDCKLNPGLTMMLEKPNRKNYSVDVVDIYNDPIHNVSMMSECRF